MITPTDNYRRTGRTTRMVMALPRTGATVLVPTQQIAKHVSQMVRRLLGEQTAKLIRVMDVATMWDVNTKLMGNTLPVHMDHTFTSFRFLCDEEVWYSVLEIARIAHMREQHQKAPK